jgi:hypothetical protein
MWRTIAVATVIGGVGIGAPSIVSLATAQPTPSVPGFIVDTYASVTDPVQLVFAPDGRLFVGRDNSGSGGGSNDALKIHVIPPSGGAALEYGNSAITDPDAVAFDASGALSGMAGSVLVGGVANPGVTGKITAIYPDESVVTLFGPTSTFLNPTAFARTPDGTLLFADYNSAKVFRIDGASITPLFDDAFGSRDITVAPSGLVYTRNANDNTVKVHDGSGTLVNGSFATAIRGNGLAVGPGGPWGTYLYAMDHDVLLRLDGSLVRDTVGTGFTPGIQDMVFGPDGALYLSDLANDRVIRVAPPGSGPVAHYPLDGDAMDISGNGRHGTLFGPTPAVDRFGNPSGALWFDGVDHWIRAQGDGLPEAERTVALWFNANQVQNHPVLLGYGGGGCGTSWFMGINATRYGTGPYVSSHCDVNTLLHPEETTTGVWHHWAISTDPAGTRMYLDGVEVESNANFVTNTTTVGTDLAIGVDVGANGIAPYVDANVGFFQGLLDDVRIYDRALTPAEIADLAGDVTAVGPGGHEQFGLREPFPNPAHGAFRVEFSLPSATPASVELIDVAGRRVKSFALRSAGPAGLSLETQGLQAGLYWVRLWQDGRHATRRVVVLK